MKDFDTQAGGPPGQTTVIYEKDGAPVIERSQVEVFVFEGPDAEKGCVLPEEGLVVGSHAAAGLRLGDPSVSRQHVRLEPAGDGVRVSDLGSTNGTMLGGNRISEAIVPLGSTLGLGETRIILRRVVERQLVPLSRRRKMGELIGASPAMRMVYALLERAAEVDVTVLLEGETGTGKELAARALHSHSPKRALGPFQIVDCGAVSPTLIEAELFGHERGSFTGADRERAGAFERAHGGTLLFDEIGELPLNLQPKLLRALEAKQVQRIGGHTRIPIDVRFVAATNRDLAKEMKAGHFREDLYYRLNVFKITMPPLREHRDDIQPLVQHFLGSQGGVQLSDEILAGLEQLDWPGNVRELRNAVERAVILSGQSFAPKPQTEPGQEESALQEPETSDAQLDATKPFKELKSELVEAFEKNYLVQVLKRTGGNISAAARESGIDRKHLERLVRKHAIDVHGR